MDIAHAQSITFILHCSLCHLPIVNPTDGLYLWNTDITVEVVKCYQCGTESLVPVVGILGNDGFLMSIKAKREIFEELTTFEDYGNINS